MWLIKVPSTQCQPVRLVLGYTHNPPLSGQRSSTQQGAMICANGTNGSCLCPSFVSVVFLPTVYGVMFLTGLPGNALSLWIFLRMIKKKISTHIYLINLGVSNLLLCTAMPFQAAYLAVGTHWLAHHTSCRLTVGGVTPIMHINIYMGLFILTWIALSRCAYLVQVSHCGRPSTCTLLVPSAAFQKLREPRFAKGICLVTWLLVVSCIFPVVVYYYTQEVEMTVPGSERLCYNIQVEVGESTSQNSSVVGIVLFTLCFLLVTCSYISLARHFLRSQKFSSISDKHHQASRVLRNIVLIQLVLVICLLPYHVFKAVFIYMVRQQTGPVAPSCHTLSWLVEVKSGLLCLAALRCSTDPIVYFLLDKTFHNHALGLLKGTNSLSGSRSLGSKDAKKHFVGARMNRSAT